MSPIPGFAAWLLAEPDFAKFATLRKSSLAELESARSSLRSLCGGDLGALQGAAVHAQLGDDGTAALQLLCSAYLAYLSPTPAGDPVARFHLDNGARLERLNQRGNMSAKGLRQSFGMMVNYLYDLDQVEASHSKFRHGEVARSRAIAAPAQAGQFTKPAT